MPPNSLLTSGDGFMFNVMVLFFKICDKIVGNGWKSVQKEDPFNADSVHHIDYADETRVAA